MPLSYHLFIWCTDRANCPFAASGLKYYDLVAGIGPGVRLGDSVVVHFDCLYRGIDVVSSRSARLLGGNRVVAEPFQFTAGGGVSTNAIRIAGDSAGGLFAGVSGPKPPPALSHAVEGMKVGGKVRTNLGCLPFNVLKKRKR